MSLDVLIGPFGCGKSTFARKHFKPTEILASDYFHALVSDDENDQSANDAFEAPILLQRKIGGRQAHGIDATGYWMLVRERGAKLSY
jgi:protein phosphatase